jgi:hypothetical protein
VGPTSRQALEFLRRLGRDAERAGGRVHALIGNHEAMRLLGDYRYVVPGEYEAFTTPESKDTRKFIIEKSPPEEREKLEEQTPLGMIEMIRAFGPDQDLGTYVRSLNAVVRINGIVFLHGGISPAVAAMSCGEINDTVRRELGRDLEKTKKAPLESLTAREDGPLWYRGLANEPDTFAPEVTKILQAQRARAIVVGHSAYPGPIRVRFDKTVFLIDTGMQPSYVPTAARRRSRSRARCSRPSTKTAAGHQDSGSRSMKPWQRTGLVLLLALGALSVGPAAQKKQQPHRRRQHRNPRSMQPR